MRIINPYVGEDVADVCRRVYFTHLKSDEPLIINFNETTIIFVKDEGGIHYKEHDIDTAEVEHVKGMHTSELYKLQAEWEK